MLRSELRHRIFDDERQERIVVAPNRVAGRVDVIHYGNYKEISRMCLTPEEASATATAMTEVATNILRERSRVSEEDGR